MSARPTLIFDFDSTLVGFETLEALADIALAGSPEADQVRAQIADLTDKAMSGEIAFGEALRRRLALLPLTRAHIATLAETAPDHLTASVRRNLNFFQQHKGKVVIGASVIGFLMGLTMCTNGGLFMFELRKVPSV